MHRILWDMRADARSEDARGAGRRGRRLGVGEYTVVLSVNGDESQTQSFAVRRDPLLSTATAAEMAGEQ